jgi:hypothetical protein
MAVQRALSMSKLLLRDSFFYLAVVVLLCTIGCSRTQEPVGERRNLDCQTVFLDQIQLDIYKSFRQDEHTFLSLRWQALTRPSADYYVFIHTIDEKGNILSQFDHPLKDEAKEPTTTWFERQVVWDTFRVTPPPGQPPGRYTLRLGVMTFPPPKAALVTHTNLLRPMNDPYWKKYSVMLPNIECQ